MRPLTPAGVLLVMTAFLVLGLSVRPVHADFPTIIPNPDASRTISWNATTADGFSLQNVTLSGGKAVLAWQGLSIPWQSFISVGSADANVSKIGNSLSLRSDTRNHVADGDFATDILWNFTDGLTGNVSSMWDSTNRSAVLGLRSPSSAESSWDHMDSPTSWECSASFNVTCTFNVETNSHDGAGALNINFSMGSEPGRYVGLKRIPLVNWSGSNRLLIWIRTFTAIPISFNVTASVSGTSRTTTSQPLSLGWQEVVINLDELGSASERSSLQNVLLRINGQNVPTTFVYFDDARLADAKIFSDSATVSQTFTKENATTPNLGSAVLSFDWVLPEAVGVRSATASVNISGASSFEQKFATGASEGWQPLVLDVSSSMAAAGDYTLSFRFDVSVDNTSSSSAHLRIDNVSFIFPNRGNGTYFSNSVSLGVGSEFLTADWTASIPDSTSVALALRSGNTSSPPSSTWSPWDTLIEPGNRSLALPGARYIQVRVDLNTTNASRTPLMSTMTLYTRHRAPQGTVIANVLRVEAKDFLGWRSFSATANRGVGTSIAFSIGDGSFWTSVPPSGDISGFPGRNLSWKAELRTTDGLQTPALARVDVIYDYLGAPVVVYITPSPVPILHPGETIKFQARAADAGNHTVPVSLFIWQTNDAGGNIVSDGTYTAGSPGVHNVTATVPSLGVSGLVQVRVDPAPFLPAQLSFWPYALIVLAAVGLGYEAYQFSIRRLFAIDDIFLIFRDGRLMMHNTRRMRADRDEDILSGMLTAILAFLRDFDREENGDLRRFEFGGKTALLERGEHAYLAAVYSGRVPRWAGKDLRKFMRDLEARFGETFARWTGSPEDLPGLKEFTERFVSRVRYRAPRGANGRAG